MTARKQVIVVALVIIVFASIGVWFLNGGAPLVSRPGPAPLEINSPGPSPQTDVAVVESSPPQLATPALAAPSIETQTPTPAPPVAESTSTSGLTDPVDSSYVGKLSLIIPVLGVRP